MWDLWWTKWHWDRFFPNTSIFPCQFHSTGGPLHGKTKKLIIFITGLHNKPQGCGASIVSAAGLFTTKKKKRTNSTKQSPSWETNISSARQEIFRILRNLQVHCLFHKSPPLVHVLSQINPAHKIPSYFLKVHFRILSSTLSSSQVVSFLQIFLPKPCMNFTTSVYLIRLDLTPS
jgi:hypothetical protein